MFILERLPKNGRIILVACEARGLEHQERSALIELESATETCTDATAIQEVSEKRRF